ncbi:hypothetical protein [Ralstonia sp.]|uniref:hypothetical protein n=1 Tax=Ralstonia sp. TaxID=54061 RepID=UPI0031DBFF44
MKLDRDYQRRLLEQLAESYPRPHDLREFLQGLEEEAEAKYVANMMYLDEHGLIESSISFGLDGHASMGMPRINHRGMDFLTDDGGLSAILGVVTVKLHADTIRELITTKIEGTPIPEEQKSKLKRHLSTLSGEAMKALTKSLVEKGLQSVPDIVHWLQTLPIHG